MEVGDSDCDCDTNSQQFIASNNLISLSIKVFLFIFAWDVTFLKILIISEILFVMTVWFYLIIHTSECAAPINILFIDIICEAHI